MAAGTTRPRGLPLTVRLAATYALLVAATLLVVAAVATQLTSIQTNEKASPDARSRSVVGSIEESRGSSA